ncbi:carboxypeptidase regulatory-like domain-containing protein [Vulcanisaeta thermophila]|uniref:carboxypeptidase regulatory-like domain-containing protein n=1 Tax=Vulcanisaeta thermophila TaxID=867917 RepID=UPI00138940A3|nr:carboxypeptidase regulatory-like domain-containing protein [Vulcanisaeta thermophila]
MSKPYVLFSNTQPYPEFITNYYSGLSALQLIPLESYSYGGIGWEINYSGSPIEVTIIGLYSIFRTAPADGFTLILFPKEGGGIRYINYSVPLFTASSSTSISGNLQLPQSATEYFAIQWDPFYGVGDQFNLYVVAPPSNLIANPGGIGCSIGFVNPGQLINLTIIYVPKPNELFVYITNEATGTSCSFNINLSNYNFTVPSPGSYWVFIESDSGEYYANWALLNVTLKSLSYSNILGNLLVVVHNALNNKPLSNALVSIPNLNETCTTNPQGTCEIKDLVPGRYELIITRSGFENLTESISIVPGTSSIETWLLPVTTMPNEGFEFLGYSPYFREWLNEDVAGMSSIFTSGFAPIGIGVYGVGYYNGDYVGYEYKYDYVVATMTILKPLNFTTWNAGFYPVPQSQSIIDLQLNFYLVIKLINGENQYYWLQNVINIHYPGMITIGPPGAFNNTVSGASFSYGTMTLSSASPAIIGYINSYPFTMADIAKLCQVTPTYVVVCFGYNTGDGTVWYSNMTIYPYTEIANAYFEIAPHGAGATPQLDLAFVLTGGYSPGQVYGNLTNGEIDINVIIRLVNGTWIVPQDAWNVGTGTAEEAQAVVVPENLTALLMPGLMKNLTMLWSLPLEVNVTFINPGHIPIGLPNGTYIGGLVLGSYGPIPLNETTACKPVFNVDGNYLYIPWLNVTGGYVILGNSLVYVGCSYYYNVTIELPIKHISTWVANGSLFTYKPPNEVSNGTTMLLQPSLILINNKVVSQINTTVSGPLLIIIKYNVTKYLVNFITPTGVSIPSEWVTAGSIINVSGPIIRTANYTAYPVTESLLVNEPMNATLEYDVNSTITVRDYLGLPAPNVLVTLICGTKKVSSLTNSLGVANLHLSDVPTVECSLEYVRPMLGLYSISLLAIIIMVIGISLYLLARRLKWSA